MSHELDVIDGQAQVIAAKPMWHALGDVVGDSFDRHTIEERMPALLSDVYKVSAVYMTDDSIVNGNTCAIVRRLDGRLVGEGHGIDSYGIVQPSQVYELGEAFAQVSDFPLVSAGALRAGRQFFFTYEGPSLCVGGEDINRHFSIVSSHDGSLATTGIDSSTIVVCANTMAMALAGGQTQIVLKHTSKVQDRLSAAMRMLELHTQRDETITSNVARLQSFPLTMREFDLLVDAVLPRVEGPAGRSQTIRDKSREGVKVLYLRDERAARFQGTAWGAIQAFNTYEQWHATVKGYKGRSEADVRAERQFDSLTKGSPLTQAALKLVAA